MGKYFQVLVFIFLSGNLALRAQNNTGKPESIQFTIRGIELYADDSIERSIQMFSRAIVSDTGYAEPRFRRANAYFKSESYQNALTDYYWMISHSAEHRAEVYESIGDIAIQLSQTIANHKVALSYYLKALDNDSSQGSYFAKPGFLYFEGENYDKCAQFLQKAIKRNFTSAEIYSKLAFSFTRLDDNKRAVLNFDKAIALDHSNMADYANRGAALLAIHQLNGAIEDFELYLKSDSTDVSVWYNLGRAHYGLQQYTLAVANMQKVLKLSPGYADIWFRLGMTYADMGNYKNAVESFDQAILQYPKEAYLYYNRAVAKAKLVPQGNFCEDLKIASQIGYTDADKMLKKVCNP